MVYGSEFMDRTEIHFFQEKKMCLTSNSVIGVSSKERLLCALH